MSFLNTVQVILVVIAISGGQSLFKRAGLELAQSGTWLSSRVWFFAGISIVVYMGATLLWIQLLRKMPLVQAYPFMAFSFVIVPLSAVWLFNEQIGVAHLIGFFLIVSGVVLITLNGQS